MLHTVLVAAIPAQFAARYNQNWYRFEPIGSIVGYAGNALSGHDAGIG